MFLKEGCLKEGCFNALKSLHRLNGCMDVGLV